MADGVINLLYALEAPLRQSAASLRSGSTRAPPTALTAAGAPSAPPTATAVGFRGGCTGGVAAAQNGPTQNRLTPTPPSASAATSSFDRLAAAAPVVRRAHDSSGSHASPPPCAAPAKPGKSWRQDVLRGRQFMKDLRAEARGASPATGASPASGALPGLGELPASGASQAPTQKRPHKLEPNDSSPQAQWVKRQRELEGGGTVDPMLPSGLPSGGARALRGEAPVGARSSGGGGSEFDALSRPLMPRIEANFSLHIFHISHTIFSIYHPIHFSIWQPGIDGWLWRRQLRLRSARRRCVDSAADNERNFYRWVWEPADELRLQ